MRVHPATPADIAESLTEGQRLLEDSPVGAIQMIQHGLIMLCQRCLGNDATGDLATDMSTLSTWIQPPMLALPFKDQAVFVAPSGDLDGSAAAGMARQLVKCSNLIMDAVLARQRTL